MAKNLINILDGNLGNIHTMTINIQLTNENNCINSHSHYETAVSNIHNSKHFLKLYMEASWIFYCGKTHKHRIDHFNEF